VIRAYMIILLSCPILLMSYSDVKGDLFLALGRF